MGFIYQILNIKSNKCYIGQSRQKNPICRWTQHKHQAFTKMSIHSALYDAMRSYGVEFFTFNVILDQINNDDLNRKEEEYIKSFNSLVPGGYNIRTGGNHTPHSEETRRKIGEKSKGRQATLGQKRTEEQKQNIGNASRGRKVGKERKEKQRTSINEWHDKHPIPHKSCKYTEEDIRYMRKNPDSMSPQDLCKKFNIRRYRLNKIIKRELYGRVKD